MKNSFFISLISIFFFTSCQTLHTRNDSSYITEIEGNYYVRFISSGGYVLPLTPEGPFPTWKYTSSFLTTGNGKIEENGDIVFYLGQNLESLYPKYDSGSLVIKKNTKEVILDATLSGEYKNSTNHSGKYNFSIDKPVINPIEIFSDQKSMVNNYVKAIGYFDGFKFYSGPYIFDDQNFDFLAWRGWEKARNQNYCVIGLVKKKPSKDTYEIIIQYLVPVGSKSNKGIK